MENVVDRFLKYVKIDTRSDSESNLHPSTSCQFDLAKVLVEDLKKLGLEDVTLDENAYVMGTLPSNINEKVPTIGFIAHMDTSPDMTGENVNPQIVSNYNGGDIVLDEEKQIILSPKDFPELKNYIGQTLITTDGNTLLGADDKAGIAEILAAIEHLIKHPEILHGEIKIGFTPDEEIGKGADLFDVEKFAADFAYTVDGGEIGELEYENFNAAGARIKIQGRNVHPGTAKNKMINSIEIAMEINSLLPENQKPQYTENYEGFFHLTDLKGSVDETDMYYIIRDHDKEQFEEKKRLLSEIVHFLSIKHGNHLIQLEIRDQYYNMKEKIEPVIDIVHLAKEAMESVNVKPKIKAIRGGTDGARLSFEGLPCPNIFTGGHNFHGRFEYIPVESMKKAVEVIVKIAELNGSRTIVKR